MNVCTCELVSMEYTWMVSVYGLEPCGLVRNRCCLWINVEYVYLEINEILVILYVWMNVYLESMNWYEGLPFIRELYMIILVII
jgi:hypothetical protein